MSLGIVIEASSAKQCLSLLFLTDVSRNGDAKGDRSSQLVVPAKLNINVMHTDALAQEAYAQGVV